MIDKIKCKNRIGNDIHKELIAMWKELQNGWIPPSHITYEEYSDVRDNRNKYPDYYVGYVGFSATFGAKWFQGYARGNENPPRDRSNESYRNLIKQLPFVQDVLFMQGDYKEYKIKNSVIYCDPPYECITKFTTGKFNYNEFWQWCREMSKNNYVFISEYNSPEDFECVWSKTSLANFDCNRGDDTKNKLRVEKLFIYNGQEVLS